MSRTLPLVALFALILSAETPTPSLVQKLPEVRYDLHIENGKFVGSAAAVLERAIAGAQYVLIGEDHITREIPQFTAAVCDVMAPQGLSAMAMEAGPQAANFVSATLTKPDRVQRMAVLLRKYPDSLAVLDIRQENDLVAHCAHVAKQNSFQLWGLDQEFLGAAGWLLDLILATHPGPAATAALTDLKAEEQRDAAHADENGDPSRLFLLTASKSELDHVAGLLEQHGSSKANALFRELMESHQIYRENLEKLPGSNDLRARLLKQNFRRDLMDSGGKQRPGKILVKFGDWHLYKGINPLHQRDLGNYIAEFADGTGTTSLHICVLGARGVHRLYAGYRRPAKLEPFVMDQDSNYRWLKPLVEAQVKDDWTLYDLRKLRFQNFGAIDPDMERLIYGYDLLVIVPEFTPADLIR